MSKIIVSIIILHYQVKKELLACLSSIYTKKTQVSFEVVVVDNDENPIIEKNLIKLFPQVKYVKNAVNNGYSGGNNLGATQAKGDVLFFLNPDTLVKKDTIDKLVAFLQSHKKAGIVAPLLLDSDGKVYPLQGTEELTPIRAIFSLSFVRKLLPNNPIANSYWYKAWNKKQQKSVDVIPGSAFMIRKNIFEKLDGFDQAYFLFFEEHDICNRVKNLGFDIYLLPQAQVVHYWGKSTQKSKKNIKKIFEKSRFYYFKKFYGLPRAFLTEAILRISNESVIVSLVFLLAVFLRFYQLEKFMMFIGDFGWFYLSARDLLLGNSFPLVGIASSHPWIYQGPFWTYLLAMGLFIGRFNPIAGGYLAGGIGVLTVIFLYFCTKQMFDKKTALFTAAFFATSPLVVWNARMPYHTAPIPLFVVLYIYSLCRCIKGNTNFFPLVLFTLAVLYNFELATFLLVPIPVFLLLYLWFVNKKRVAKSFSKKILVFSVLGIVIPLIPMIIFDFHHYFGQTVGFIAWLGYRFLILFGYPRLHPEIADMSPNMFSFLFRNQQLFFFAQNGWIGLGMFVLSLIVVIRSLIVNKNNEVYVLILLTIILPVLGLLGSKLASDAYLPMVFIQLAILVGILCNHLSSRDKGKSLLVYGCFVVVIGVNIFSLFSENFYTPKGLTFTDRMNAAKEIVKKADGKEYNLIGKGTGSQFASFTMNYQYLTWYLGHAPSQKQQKLKLYVGEDKNGIYVR